MCFHLSFSFLQLLNGGHAAFLGYSIAMSPHYLRDVPSIDDGTEWNNFANGTVLPSIVGVFRGTTPTEVTVDATWAQFNDTTIGAPISYQTGWLMGTVVVQRGDQVMPITTFA